MDLYEIDRLSVTGNSWLHRVPAGLKLAILVVLIGLLLWLRFAAAAAGVLVVMLVLAATARLPMRLVLGLTLYPVVFLVLFFLSVHGVTLPSVLLTAARVLAITASVIVFVLTTGYPAIFGVLSRFLPGSFIAALFFTYRSLFVIADSLHNVRTALHVRGAANWRRPVATLRQFGMALGHLMVNSIDASERMADSLTVRGFANRVYWLGRRGGHDD